MVGAMAPARRPGRDPSRPLPQLLPPRLRMVDDLVRGVHTVLEEQPFPVDSRSSTWTADGSRPTYQAQWLRPPEFQYGGGPSTPSSPPTTRRWRPIAHRDELFPRSPWCSWGSTTRSSSRGPTQQATPGCARNLRTGDIVELATTLRPATRRIVVVGDATPTAAAQLEAYRAVAPQRPDLAFVYPRWRARIARSNRRAGARDVGRRRGGHDRLHARSRRAVISARRGADRIAAASKRR